MLRVLVVDDARLLADLSGTALGRETIDLHRAGLADDIVELAERLAPRVVIVTDGDACFEPLGACRRLRANPRTRETRIVYVGSFLSRPTTREAGIDLFLPRFVQPHELREALARVLDVPGRAARRWRVELPCMVSAPGGDRRGTCLDLSMSGCFVELDGAVEAGASATVRLEGDEAETVLSARAVRSGSGPEGQRGTAFGFVLDDAATSALLSRFVRQAAERRAALEGYAAGVEGR